MRVYRGLLLQVGLYVRVRSCSQAVAYPGLPTSSSIHPSIRPPLSKYLGSSPGVFWAYSRREMDELGCSEGGQQFYTPGWAGP